MGSGSSAAKHKVLRAPAGYPSDKFRKICVLFDKLDQDSNFGVSSDELSGIARLHVENCIRNLRKKIDAESSALARRLVDIAETEAREVRRAQHAAKREKAEAMGLHTEDVEVLQKKIKGYEDLDAAGKQKAFMQVLLGSGDSGVFDFGNRAPNRRSQIEFWTFFEYMKNRVDDIANLPAETLQAAA